MDRRPAPAFSPREGPLDHPVNRQDHRPFIYNRSLLRHLLQGVDEIKPDRSVYCVAYAPRPAIPSGRGNQFTVVMHYRYRSAPTFSPGVHPLDHPAFWQDYEPALIYAFGSDVRAESCNVLVLSLPGRRTTST